MRNFCLAVATLSLLATGAFADTAPLSAGQPAGLKHAQEDDNTVFYIVGLGAIAAGIAIIASDNGSNGSVTAGTISTQ